MSEKSLLTTMTGEIFQPVRLHYEVFDRQAILQLFKKVLHCQRPRPAPLDLALRFRGAEPPFKKPCAEIPEQYHPDHHRLVSPAKRGQDDS